MTWLRKKTPNPEDGDFPTFPKHYGEQKGKPLTKSVKVAPSLHWSGGPTVIWGIDVGPQVTTVSFAYLLTGQSVEVHNIVYWPKAFPLRQSDNSDEPLPQVEKTYKLRETYEAAGFVSHPAWPSERTVNYIHVIGTENSPPAFQVRTELPFLEVANERYKYVDLVEHLLKHALSVYGAVIKPEQPRWSRASDVVVSLPSGISKSTEISVTEALNHMVQRVMPKVIGTTQVYYVSRPDLRLFEDDTWRNLDTNFQHNDTFINVDWDLTTGDMVCSSYRVRRLPGGQTAFDTRQRSYLQSTPTIRKRASSADSQEGTRFASALHWSAQQKHGSRKLMIRVSNPFKKSEGLLAAFHKSLDELGLQVGIRLIDPTTETGSFGAVLWRIAHVAASSDQSNEGDTRLIRDATGVQSAGTGASTPEMSEREWGRLPGSSRVTSSFYPEQRSGPISTPELPVDFASSPLSWSPNAMIPSTSVANSSYMSISQSNIKQPSENIAGSSTILDFPDRRVEEEAHQTFPPAYISDHDTKAYLLEKSRKQE
ncbi:hypothetical protein RSOLAG1IB_04847 [Rhizoctonia solani AG-1 IB]|uniref:Uncharacterized protein n=1 Tax=Thanatephorus cucumeris (strain AG1-IB / isolate 7/3/14) TaxID=1108050 RepID=A0A0B7FX20_THACB|nr:hypothetical protein RSOLAG1IB_04847 [Rhizoctonia solani AG-1 IB]